MCPVWFNVNGINVYGDGNTATTTNNNIYNDNYDYRHLGVDEEVGGGEGEVGEDCVERLDGLLRVERRGEG